MRWLKKILKFILTGLAILIALTALYAFYPADKDLSYLADRSDPYTVRILRDTYGVPHIFGRTDADASYGLAYAHSEDDFLTIQQVLLAARGNLATVYGKDSAPADYLVQFLRVWDTVNAQYDKLSPGEARFGGPEGSRLARAWSKRARRSTSRTRATRRAGRRTSGRRSCRRAAPMPLPVSSIRTCRSIRGSPP